MCLFDSTVMDFSHIVPYTCVYLDASFKDLLKAAQESICGCADRATIMKRLQNLWTNDNNPNLVFPCLSVRTAFDLFLRVKNYPPGSEVIMSAVNIPDMVRVLHHHRLKIVPLDVNLESMAPKLELLENLVSEKTVAILVAHLFAKEFDIEPFVEAVRKYKLDLIDDRAECFMGFDRIGHPGADLTLFSFGAIKFYTSFGGAIAKVREDSVYEEMVQLCSTYQVQSRSEYLYKVLKYSFVYLCLNCPRFMKPGMGVLRILGVDVQNYFVQMLRGFPDNMIQRIRAQPSTALLHIMLQRHLSFDPKDLQLVKLKGDYVSERLPNSVTQVGQKAQEKSYWLFPVVVDNPDETLKALNALGVDAYRGATQLNMVEPDNGNLYMRHLHSFVTRYPHEAKFLIDHVVYLPVNKTVPFNELDKICNAMDIVTRKQSKKCDYDNPLATQIKLQSKL